MILITPAQCRAARALLNWSQPDLAQRCDMHVQTISAFESENGSPTKKTLEKIATLLERAGIEFGVNNGVSIADNKLFHSKNYIEVLEDCLQNLDRGDEILFHFADDRLSSETIIDIQNQIGAKGIIMRATTCAANDKMRNDRKYVILPDDYFKTHQLTLVYQDKFSIHVDLKLNDDRFVTIKNKNLANVMRSQFEYWWKVGKEIPK